MVYDANLKREKDGKVTISAVSNDQEYCTPANCSEKIFWKKKQVIGDENYFTLESYNVNPGSKNFNKLLGNTIFCCTKQFFIEGTLSTSINYLFNSKCSNKFDSNLLPK